MRRDALLPEEQLAGVVTALYADADRAGWDTLSPGDRSRAYSAWIDDSRIGGVLTGYMTPEAARSWIKDGPMKEYGRASRGAGRYARFGRSGGTGPADVAAAALGAGATVVTNSSGVKPFHCLAETSDGQTVYLAWGDARNFRNLIWAALRAAVDDDVPAHIIVTEPPGLVTPTEEAQRHEALAERCGLHVHHMREVLGSRPVGQRE